MKYILCFALFIVVASAGVLVQPVHHAAVLPVVPLAVHPSRVQVVHAPAVLGHGVHGVHGRSVRNVHGPIGIHAQPVLVQTPIITHTLPVAAHGGHGLGPAHGGLYG